MRKVPSSIPTGRRCSASLEGRIKEQNKTMGRKSFFFPTKKDKDSNVMDVDVMSTDECSQLMKKRACFNCKKIGHLLKDCSDKKQGGSSQKRNGKNTYTQIWAMITQFLKEEKKNMI